MPRTFRAVAVKARPDLFDSRRVKGMVWNAQMKIGRDMVRDISSTVEYWKAAPTFDYKMHYKGGDLYMDIVIGGSIRGKKYWRWADEGTATKNVVFTPDYRPKSEVPGKFNSNTAGVDTLPRQKIAYKWIPHAPGIRARNWTFLLRTKYYNRFIVDMANAVKRGLQPK